MVATYLNYFLAGPKFWTVCRKRKGKIQFLSTCLNRPSWTKFNQYAMRLTSKEEAEVAITKVRQMTRRRY
jgi:hypothetical protein